jgi:hypothetical protein
VHQEKYLKQVCISPDDALITQNILFSLYLPVIILYMKQIFMCLKDIGGVAR